MFRPLLNVRGDDDGVRSGRRGVARLDVVCIFEYRLCLSLRWPRSTCEPAVEDDDVVFGGGDGGNIISGCASSVFVDVEL